MAERAVAGAINRRLRTAAQALRVTDPVPYVGEMIDRSFSLPPGAPEYGENSLTPGAVPFEPSFSEQEARAVRFVIEPLAGAGPLTRRDEATRNVRQLTAQGFGRDALRWFDRLSEEWRGSVLNGHARYGGWFGAAFDDDGLLATKAYYELMPGQLAALGGSLRGMTAIALESVPALQPVFTSIRVGRESGAQRVTFLCRGELRLTDLQPLLERLGMAHQLPSIMQIVGLALGGRFELPGDSIMIGLRETAEGAEVRLEILLPQVPDVPTGFLDLLTLGLSERPRELQALTRWLEAFTPDPEQGPGQFSVLSIRVTPRTPARVSLYLRPIEFDLLDRIESVQSAPVHA